MNAMSKMSRPAQACKISPSSNPDTKFAGKIERVTAVPIAAGTFERGPASKPAMRKSPGMTCSIKVTAYQKAEALSAPLTCVFQDEADDDKSVVYVWKARCRKVREEVSRHRQEISRACRNPQRRQRWRRTGGDETRSEGIGGSLTFNPRSMTGGLVFEQFPPVIDRGLNGEGCHEIAFDFRNSLVAGRAFAEPPPKPPPPANIESADLEAAISKGVAFLLKNQRPDGAFGGPEKTKGLNIMASRAGLAQRLSDRRHLARHRRPDRKGADTAEAKRVIDKAEAWLFEQLPKLRRATPDELYNVWAHGYGIQALVRMHGRLPDDAARGKQDRRADPRAVRHADALRIGRWRLGLLRFQRRRRSGRRRRSTSFVNAAVLVALARGARTSASSRRRSWSRAPSPPPVRQQKPDFTYLYGEYLKWSADASDQPPGRQPGPLAGVQPGPAAVGRHEDHRRRA